MSPEVSIILPTQGRRATLAGALRSALAQGGMELEVVVVDDDARETGWTRRSEWAALLADPRVQVVPFRQARGCAAAKNAGLHAARGEWICYLDDDNAYLPGKVDAQLALARTSGCPLVLCGLMIEVAGRRRIRQVDRCLFRGDELLLAALPDTNVLFHRRVGSPRWDEELGTADDACFFQAWIAAARLSEVPSVARPLVLYRAHSGERANVDLQRVHRGQRRLLIRWAGGYSRAARRIVLGRCLVAREKFRPGGWGKLGRAAARLWSVGGWREWRTIANAAAVKVPVLRRWMVT